MWLTHVGKTNPEIDVFRDVLSIKNGKMSSQEVSLLLFVHKPFFVWISQYIWIFNNPIGIQIYCSNKISFCKSICWYSVKQNSDKLVNKRYTKLHVKINLLFCQNCLLEDLFSWNCFLYTTSMVNTRLTIKSDWP